MADPRKRSTSRSWRATHTKEAIERLLQAESIPEGAKVKLREVAGVLDPLKLLEEMRAVQAHLTALADGEIPPSASPEPPDLAAFVASLSSAWRAGEVRPTFSAAAKPRYLRSLQSVPRAAVAPAHAPAHTMDRQLPAQSTAPAARRPERPQLIYAGAGKGSFRALKAAWPIACRRLEGCPNINSSQLFEELCVQFPGRFNPNQRKTLTKRVKIWRQDARARGVVIDHIKCRDLNHKPRGIRPDPFKAHWSEMLQCLEARPDQTALELLLEFRARHPERYTLWQLSTMERRVRVWRREAVKRLICDNKGLTQDVAAEQW